jgi:hypothetical protein
MSEYEIFKKKRHREPEVWLYSWQFGKQSEKPRVAQTCLAACGIYENILEATMSHGRSGEKTGERRIALVLVLEWKGQCV